MRKLQLIGLVLWCVFTMPAWAVKKGEILIWIGEEKGYKGIEKVGKTFYEKTGIKVKVETPDSMTTLFDRLAATHKGPDIVVWAHDRFGVWINEGMLEPVTPSQKMRNSVAPFTWQAVMVGDQAYGFPISIEAVSLIYNTDLVNKPPKTLSEVVALDKKLKKSGKSAIEWDYKTTYFTWPIIASTGAYSFGRKNGFYSLLDVGFSTPGAANAIEEVGKMLKGGVLSKSANYGSMIDKFKKGEVASIIAGPWAWEELVKAGVNFDVAPVPGAGKSPKGRPFVGVLAAGISAFSREKAYAQMFLEDYLLTYEGVKQMDSDKPLGAAANKRLMAELASDPKIKLIFRIAENGEIMPDIPEMKRFWGQFATHLPRMLYGEEKASSTLEKIANKMKRMEKVKGFRRRHYPSEG